MKKVWVYTIFAYILKGEDDTTTRNVRIESGRIARGKVYPLADLKPIDVDAVIIPGKNSMNWVIHAPSHSFRFKNKVRLIYLGNISRWISTIKNICTGFTFK